MLDNTFANKIIALQLGEISFENVMQPEDTMNAQVKIAAEQLRIPAESIAFNFDARALALLRTADGDPANADALEKEYAAESEAQAAQGSASAQAGAQVFTADGTPTLDSCQEFPGAVSEIPPMSFADIEAAIANAARQRIENAARAIVDARERIEREHRAREAALDAAQVRVGDARRAVEAVDEKHAATARRVETFVADADERAMLLAALDAVAARERTVANDALAEAESMRDEAIGEIKAARLADALELQLLEQDTERWQAAAPDVAAQMRRADDAEKFARRAMDAVQRGDVKAAERALNDARTNGLPEDHAATLAGVIASAKNAKALRDLHARAERVLTAAEQIGAVGKIAQVERDAARMGVANDKAIKRLIVAAYKQARAAKQARRAQAQPLAKHIEDEGLIAVVADGRIEGWKSTSNGHGAQWTLDSVILFNEKYAVWVTETPRVPVIRKDDPRKGRGS
jgi:hypothetical protein